MLRDYNLETLPIKNLILEFINYPNKCYKFIRNLTKKFDNLR